MRSNFPERVGSQIDHVHLGYIWTSDLRCGIRNSVAPWDNSLSMPMIARAATFCFKANNPSRQPTSRIRFPRTSRESRSSGPGLAEVRLRDDLGSRFRQAVQSCGKIYTARDWPGYPGLPHSSPVRPAAFSDPHGSNPPARKNIMKIEAQVLRPYSALATLRWNRGRRIVSPRKRPRAPMGLLRGDQNRRLRGLRSALRARKARNAGTHQAAQREHGVPVEYPHINQPLAQRVARCSTLSGIPNVDGNLGPPYQVPNRRSHIGNC